MKGWKNYRQLANSWRKTFIKTWVLVLLLIIFSGLSAWGLRTNNMTMIRLRDDVLKADKQGRAVDAPLNKLMYHSLNHMNASVENLGLVSSYQRDVGKAEQIAKQQNRLQGSSNVTVKGQKYCEKSVGVDPNGYATRIAQCVKDYVSRHGGSADSTYSKVVYPDETLYYFSFTSPRWSPDIAGFSLLIVGVITVWLISRLILRFIAIIIIRYRNR